MQPCFISINYSLRSELQLTLLPKEQQQSSKVCYLERNPDGLAKINLQINLSLWPVSPTWKILTYWPWLQASVKCSTARIKLDNKTGNISVQLLILFHIWLHTVKKDKFRPFIESRQQWQVSQLDRMLTCWAHVTPLCTCRFLGNSWGCASEWMPHYSV